MKFLLLNVNARASGIELSVVPPLGLLTISAVLKQKGIETKFVDADRENLQPDTLIEKIQQFQPQFIGITMNTIMAGYVIDTVKFIKKRFPDISIIVGGPHPSGFRGKVLEDCSEIDYLIIGEGEYTIVDLLEAVENGSDLDNVKGIAYRNHSGEVTVTASRPFEHDLDKLPMPDMEAAFPLNRYPGVFPSIGSPSLHLMTSRGCPFSCSFCSNPVWGKGSRYQSAGRVLDEMERLVHKFGAKEIYILDDTFNAPKKRAKEIFRGIIERGLNEKTYFRCLFRANEQLIDKELLDLAAEANVWLIFFGIESGSKRVNELINKQIKLEEMERAIRMTHEAGIRTICSFMIGNLGDSKESVRETIEFAKRLSPDYYDFPIATPLPLTPYYENALKKNLIKTFDYHKYTFQTAVCETEYLGLDEINSLRKEAFQELREYKLSSEYLKVCFEELLSIGYDQESAWNAVHYDMSQNINNESGYITFLPHQIKPAFLNNRIDFGLDDRAALSGRWYPAENDGSFFRWIEQKGTFYLPVSGDGVLEIEISTAYPPLAENSGSGCKLGCQIVVNGVLLKEVKLSDHGKYSVSVELNEVEENRIFHQVELVAEKTWRPSDYGKDNNDRRKLSFKIYSAEFRPFRVTSVNSDNKQHHNTAGQKVVLINPNTRNTGRVATTNPPMGILYVAGYLREMGENVVFLDADTDDLSFEDIARVISQGCKIAGITMTTFQSASAYELAEKLKQMFPDLIVAVGGAHPSAVNKDVIRDCSAVDIAVVGEGEAIIAEIVRAVSAGRKVDSFIDIKGICFRSGENIIFTGPREYIDIESLPYPAIDLAQPLNKYQSSFPPSRRERSFIVMGTRGCPFNCKFCGTNKIWGRKVRWRIPKSVVNEIEHLYSTYGVDEIFFLDDTLNFSKKWLMELCDEIEKSFIYGKVIFKGSLRANIQLVSEEIFARLKNVGFWLVAFGVESGNRRILENIGKNLTVEEVEHAFMLAKKAGLRTIGSFMIGNLGEDRASVMDTINLACKLKPDYYDFPLATPLPGTEYRQLAEERGLIEIHDYRKYGMGKAVCRTEHLGLQDLEELRMLAFQMMKTYVGGISLEYKGMWLQDENSIMRGRRDNKGNHADIMISVEKEFPEYQVSFQYLDKQKGTLTFYIHDNNDKWLRIGDLQMEGSGNEKSIDARISCDENNIPRNDLYFILDTHGLEFHLISISVKGVMPDGSLVQVSKKGNESCVMKSQDSPSENGNNKIGQLKSAIWFLTWKCNNKCPYCWEVQRQARGEFVPDDFKDAEKWVQAWNRLKPGILDISGGEPWLQPGFIDMLERFDSSIKVAITTNATKDFTEFVERISPEKVFSMTLSFHPTQRMSTDIFLGKCLLLKNRGFHITVNFVTWPEQMWLIPMYKEFFEKAGLRFHVDPYAATPHYPYKFNEHEKEFLKQYVGDDRAHWFGEVEKYPVLCSGGYEHLNVQPNGDAYRCINDKILHKKMVGNLLDGEFSLNSEWTFCEDYYRCPGCDKDKIKVKRISSSKETEKSEPLSYTL